jgi:hypothetical protein
MDIQIFEPIPPKFIQHKIELDTTIPPARQVKNMLNANYATIVKQEGVVTIQ